MSLNPSSQAMAESAAGRPLPNRRELLAAATALLASGAAGASAQAAAGAEGYFLVFEKPGGPAQPDDPLDRIFFIPSAWLELFEVTDAYKAIHPTNWTDALGKVRGPGTPGKKQKFHVLYADTVDPDVEVPFPNLTVIPPVPPGANQTYLAAMLSP